MEPVLIAEGRKAAVKALCNHEMEEPPATARVCSDSTSGKMPQVRISGWILIPVVNL